MSTPNINSPVQPDLAALLNSHKLEVMQATNCHLLGEIVSYDAAKVTCTVQIKSQRQVGDALLSYPVLTDCPVFQLMGGRTYLSLPIKAGDPCLVLFHDQDMDNWFTTGNTSVPNTGRMHSLSDGLVIVGFRNIGKSPSTSSSNTILLINDEFTTRVEVGPEVAMEKGNQQVRLTTGGKVKITSQSSANFQTAMGVLFTALKAWVNTGGSTPNPATVTAITSAETAFNEIFE